MATTINQCIASRCSVISTTYDYTSFFPTRIFFIFSSSSIIFTTNKYRIILEGTISMIQICIFVIFIPGVIYGATT